ncbi:hypothetical protein [Kocuria sp. CPCC 205263]|uniref:hypothetical protein n=1 Tax=Kocuria sp. CPCC 205263 TaxID=3073555 RepID=UPI0034D6C214
MPTSLSTSLPAALLRTSTVLAPGALALTGCASSAQEAAPSTASISASGAPSRTTPGAPPRTNRSPWSSPGRRRPPVEA